MLGFLQKSTVQELSLRKVQIMFQISRERLGKFKIFGISKK